MSLILSGTDGLSDVDGSAATPAIRGTDTNTGIFFPAADTIAFSEGGAEAMRIDSSGRLLVGTNSAFTGSAASAKFQTIGNTSNTAGSAIVAIGRGTAATSITSNDEIGWVMFTDNAGNQFASINCNADANAGASDYPGRLVFSTTADGAASLTERARIPSTGGFQCVNSISVGNATPTTSGAGITFPATQSASSNANTLDDYEEGTWTPNDQSGASLSFTVVNSEYIKIGKMVYACTNITYPSTASGLDVSIGGLPFTCGSNTAWGCIIRFTTFTTAIVSDINPGGTIIRLRTFGGTDLTNTNMSTKNICVVAVYGT